MKLATVCLRAMPFDDEAAQMMGKLPFDAPFAWRDWLEREIRSGRARVLSLDVGGARAGTVVYRVDEQEKRELRVLAAYAEHSQNLTPEIFAAVEDLARENGCVSVCFSTIRPGLVKQGASAGYRVAEVFMAKDIA